MPCNHKHGDGSPKTNKTKLISSVRLALFNHCIFQRITLSPPRMAKSWQWLALLSINFDLVCSSSGLAVIEQFSSNKRQFGDGPLNILKRQTNCVACGTLCCSLPAVCFSTSTGVLQCGSPGLVTIYSIVDVSHIAIITLFVCKIMLMHHCVYGS